MRCYLMLLDKGVMAKTDAVTNPWVRLGVAEWQIRVTDTT